MKTLTDDEIAFSAFTEDLVIYTDSLCNESG